MPDSLGFIPPPPAAGTAAMDRDETVRTAALALRGTPRFRQAIVDADRNQDATDRAFQCALGIEIGPAVTPVLSRMLAKLRLDVRASIYPAKLHFRRPRPWAVHGSEVCAPSEKLVRDDGSYPSARAAVGWGYALVLSKLGPDRQALIMDRGREFGQSRVICDAEWQSDVDAGRLVAEAVVARLQKVGQFRSDLSAAKQELARARTEHHGGVPGCSG